MDSTLTQPWHITVGKSKKPNAYCTTVNDHGRTELRVYHTREEANSGTDPFFREFANSLKLNKNGKITRSADVDTKAISRVKGKTITINNEPISEEGRILHVTLWDHLKNQAKQNHAEHVIAEDKHALQQVKERNQQQGLDRLRQLVKQVKVKLRPDLPGSKALKDRQFNIEFSFNPNEVIFVDGKGEKKHIEFKSVELHRSDKEIVLNPVKGSMDSYGWVVMFDELQNAKYVNKILQYGLDQLSALQSAHLLDADGDYYDAEDMDLGMDNMVYVDYNQDWGSHVGYHSGGALLGSDGGIQSHPEILVLSGVVLLVVFTLLCFCVGAIFGFGVAQVAVKEKKKANMAEYGRVSNGDDDDDDEDI
eukprot:235149_1